MAAPHPAPRLARNLGFAAEADPARGRESLPRRLATFLGERFPPLVYGPLIIAFASSGVIGAATSGDHQLSLPGWLGTWLAVGLAFFRMRLVDEIRDADVDRLGRPWRPVPRGLVSVDELQTLARGSLLVMLVITAALGYDALLAGVLVTAFGLLAGRNFFATRLLRDRPLATALAHSPAVPLLMLLSWAADPTAAPAPQLAWLLLLAWTAGLGLEIGRKTVAPAEERPYVDTYSARLGQPRAVLLAGAFLAVGAIAAGGYAASMSAPGLTGPGAAWLGDGLALGVVAAAAIAASAIGLLRADGRIVNAWSAGLTLILFVAPPLVTLASGAVSPSWSVW